MWDVNMSQEKFETKMRNGDYQGDEWYEDYTTQMVMDQMQTLYRVQRSAAKEQGYRMEDEFLMTPGEMATEQKKWDKPLDWDAAKYNTSYGDAWRNYLDPKEFPPATTCYAPPTFVGSLPRV